MSLTRRPLASDHIVMKKLIAAIAALLALLLTACGSETCSCQEVNPGCVADQDCNHLLEMSSLAGACNDDGTCTCGEGREQVAETGKCR